MPADPIDLAAERNRRAQPDADCMTQDEYGRPVFTYLGSYTTDDGKTYSMEFYAMDDADAGRRISGMRATLTLDGKLFSRVSA